MNPQHPIKCKCAVKNSNGSCPRCSRVKMAIMLPHGSDAFKQQMPDGTLVNPVWYNYMKNNRADERTIISGMLRRFQENILSKVCNKVIFYDNTTKSPIGEVKF